MPGHKAPFRRIGFTTKHAERSMDMFVVTTKLSKTKIAAAVTLVIAAVVLVGILAAAGGGLKEPEDGLAGEPNEARVAFLAKYGWQVNAEPVQTQSVKIPREDSELFTRYNELQKSQGFDLTALAGQQATRYVYEVLNYPGSGSPVYATVFVHRGKIVGGDVTDSAPEGKMQGFRKADS